MFSLARRFDGWVAASRPGWLWLGQLGIVALGAHLAADRLDDVIVGVLRSHPIPYVSENQVLLGSIVLALVLEVLVVARAAWVLVASAGAPDLDHRAWWRKRSVEGFVRPAFWGVMTAAGAWSILIAVEDRLPGFGQVGTWVGAVAGALAVWRLGWTGWQKITAGLFLPKSKADGVLWAPPLVLFTGLGLMQLPIWGWT